MSRSQSLPGTVSDRAELERVSVALLEKSTPLPKAVRLLGVSLSALQAEAGDEPQMTLLL